MASTSASATTWARTDGTLVGRGSSRVVKNQDPDAHAKREAIRDAQERLGRLRLPGSLLYSTSRPCSLCEAAAARAGVGRMYFGPSLRDAGVPGQPRPGTGCAVPCRGDDLDIAVEHRGGTDVSLHVFRQPHPPRTFVE